LLEFVTRRGTGNHFQRLSPTWGEQGETRVTDEELVKRAGKGDQRAFDLLVRKYQHRIFALISRYVRDQDEVQDVAQEAFIKAWRALPRFRGDSQFYTWLYRIAVNTAKNYLVARGRRPPGSDIDADEAEQFIGADGLHDSGTPESILMSQQLADVITKAIEALPHELRTAVTLREFDGLSYEDIAAIMECPVGTVRSRIFRAREAIEQAMRPVMDQDSVMR
jgi:RNA polymerase sigma-70 factor (ECF subfamily)